MAYNGTTEVASGLKQMGTGNYKLVNAQDVYYSDDKSAKQAIDEKLGSQEAEAQYIPKPGTSPDGQEGQLLKTNGDGTTTWTDQGTPTSAQVGAAVSTWLNNHPEATTTVQDGSITEEKLASALAAKADKIDENTQEIADLKSAYNDLYTEINDDADIPSSINWYQGAFYPSTGGDYNTPTNRIRSGWVTLTKDIVGLKPLSGYKYEIYAWNAAQTYLGVWNGSEWSKSAGKFFTEPFSLANFDKTNKYKFVLGRTDDTTIATTESTNLKYVCSRFVDIENDIEDLEAADSQLNAKIDQYMHKQAFDVSESWTSPFIVEDGETVHINVTSVTGTINVFTLGYLSTVYLQITAAGEYTFTATNTGAIRFYLDANNAISGTIWIDSRIDAEKARIDDVYSPGAITPIMGDLAIKTKNVFDSFTINSGSFSFTVGVSNISNYTDYATASSNSKNTPPVRIRDFNGQLIYNNLRLNLDKESKPTTCMWLFDKNGYYLRAVTHSDFYHRTAYFLDDEYFAIFNLFPGVSGYEDYAWIVDNVNIEWLNAAPEYHVGADKEFTTFNGMLTALADDPREKVVYIDPGEYDIFEEYGGADYMASLAATASTLNWRDVCKVVPTNTHIIGLGDVTLKWDASAEDMQSSDVATLFSPLNVSGNCVIENLKVIGRNCRYAVHDETSGLSQYNGAVHHYKNCYFECLQSTYNATTPYGSGHNKNMTLIFDDCEFVNYQNNAWATHHQAASATEKSTIIFNHCIFRRSRTGSDFYVQFTTDKTNGLKDEVRFNGCYIAAKIKFYTASASAVGQGYDVTLVGSSQVEVVYSENVTTRYDVRQLNPVS